MYLIWVRQSLRIYSYGLIGIEIFVVFGSHWFYHSWLENVLCSMNHIGLIIHGGIDEKCLLVLQIMLVHFQSRCHNALHFAFSCLFRWSLSG